MRLRLTVYDDIHRSQNWSITSRSLNFIHKFKCGTGKRCGWIRNIYVGTIIVQFYNNSFVLQQRWRNEFFLKPQRPRPRHRRFVSLRQMRVFCWCCFFPLSFSFPLALFRACFFAFPQANGCVNMTFSGVCLALRLQSDFWSNKQSIDEK